MKTVLLNQHTREMFDEYSDDGESADATLNRLLDASEILCDVDSMDLTRINIGIHEETFERMKQYKIAPNESHSDTILRLLLQVR